MIIYFVRQIPREYKPTQEFMKRKEQTIERAFLRPPQRLPTIVSLSTTVSSQEEKHIDCMLRPQNSKS